MKYCKAKQNYSILELNEEFVVEKGMIYPDFTIDQYEGDELEIWKERPNGYLFVYCNRMLIGYWVLETLVERI